MGEKKRIMMRPARPSRRLRQMTLILGSCLVFYCLLFVSRTPQPHRAAPAGPTRQPPAEILNNLSLDEDQCNAAFPGLTKEIDDVVAEGPFLVKQTSGLGPLQGRIQNGQVRASSLSSRGTTTAKTIRTDGKCVWNRYTSSTPSADPTSPRRCST